MPIDQAAEVGFDMVIMTFGSGFNFESRDTGLPSRATRRWPTTDASKGVALGGYSLLASRGAGTGAENTQGVPAKLRRDALPRCAVGEQLPRADQTLHGRRRAVRARARRLLSRRPMRRHQSSLPSRPGRFAVGEWRAITDLYQWCRADGIYLNIPTGTTSRREQVRHGLPRGELVLPRAEPGDHRAPEHLRRHLGEDPAWAGCSCR
jgi:hypothetical protein